LLSNSNLYRYITGALYVKGGAHIGGETYIGKTLDIESNTVVGGKLSVFYGLAVGLHKLNTVYP
jgi:NDP-sugar pyrophosphorylase family protein